MLRPVKLSNSRQISGTRQIATIAAAGVVELALISALVSGFAARVASKLPEALSMVDIATPAPPPPDLVQPTQPRMIEPTVPAVSLPDIVIRRPEPTRAITVVAVDKSVVPQQSGPGTVPVAAPEPAPAAIPSTALRSVGATHTIPPYPELAVRLGEQGRVQLRITVSAQGEVADAVVIHTSGSPRLDDAAREWVLAHWRYEAATEEGKPIAGTTDAIVEFNLKNAR